MDATWIILPASTKFFLSIEVLYPLFQVGESRRVAQCCQLTSSAFQEVCRIPAVRMVIAETEFAAALEA